MIVAVTGDLTAAAEPPAYEAMYNFLTGSVAVSGRYHLGLGLSQLHNRFCVVPGNHDVWLRADPFSKWSEYADRRDLYATYFSEPLPDVRSLVVNGRSITLYTMDSNRLAHTVDIANLENALGRGKVGTPQINGLNALHASLLEGRQSVGEPGYDYASSLKIAMLHHHLALPADTPRGWRQMLLELVDAEDVLHLLHGIDVRLVLCGHQHRSYRLHDLKAPAFSGEPLVLSCAESVTQCKCQENSFQFYKFFAEGDKRYTVQTVTYTANPSQDRWLFAPTADARFQLGGH
jgi:3',5'-cyclic AMP phosphodiesterase CpdA